MEIPVSVIYFLVVALVASATTTYLVVRAKIRWIQDRESSAARLAIRETELERSRIEDKLQIQFEKKQIEREREWNIRELALEDREEALAEKDAEVTNREALIQKESELLSEEKRKLDKLVKDLQPLRKRYLELIETKAETTRDEAREFVFEETRREAAREIETLKAEILKKSEAELEAEAKKTLLAVMQRISSSPNMEASATLVPLPNEEMKGRIIGREGRNIRSFEALTATTLLVDETPDSVLISAFDPVRREVARQALVSLLNDGRIHPASIEEAVQAAEDEMRKNVIELGEEALRKLRLNQVHPDIVTLLGKMHYRLSMNQNALEHSIEVARIASLLASEIGYDPTIAKRAGLLHDIGKAMDSELEGSHAHVAASFLKRLGESPEVVNAVAASHGEVPAETAYVGLVMLADSLSASRPGARSDSLQSYIQRMKSLETVATDIPGVKEAYALQAGRELRVIVKPEEVTDDGARLLARRICTTIEDKLEYPSKIKIVVVREQRFQETAV